MYQLLNYRIMCVKTNLIKIIDTCKTQKWLNINRHVLIRQHVIYLITNINGYISIFKKWQTNETLSTCLGVSKI